MEKFLVIGGDGLIGKALYHYLQKQGYDVTRTTRKKPTSPEQIYFDLSEKKHPSFSGYQHAFLCAGITNIALCESDSVLTSQINIDATVALAKELVQSNCRVYCISSSAVFDGLTENPQETESYSYQTEYGRQKAEVECQLMALGNFVSIIRITKLISLRLPLFAGFYNKLLANQTLTVYHDLLMSPISSDYLCESLLRITLSKLGGVFHLSGENSLSYYDFGIQLAEQMGKERGLVQGVPAENVLFKPKYAGLGMKRTQNTLNIFPEAADQVITKLIKTMNHGVMKADE